MHANEDEDLRSVPDATGHSEELPPSHKLGRTLGDADWRVEEQLITKRKENYTVGDIKLGAANGHRHPNSARFHKLLEEIGLLHDRKQADYGRGNDPFANVRAASEWRVEPWVGAMIRATDKVRRLQAFIQNGRLANEGVADSLKDLAVYSLIALVLFEEMEASKKLVEQEQLSLPF